MTRLRLLLFACLSLMAWPAAAAQNLIVGAIYVGSVNDYGYNRAMHDGLMAMKEAVPASRCSKPKTCRNRPRPNGSWKG